MGALRGTHYCFTDQGERPPLATLKLSNKVFERLHNVS